MKLNVQARRKLERLEEMKLSREHFVSTYRPNIQPWIKAEIAALEWAIEVIKRHYASEA